MIANSGVIAPLPYSHGSSGSGLTHFSPNNEVFLGRFLPFFAHCVVGFCWYRWWRWPWLPWWVWRQWCPITPLWAVSPVSLLLQRRRVGKRMTGTIWEHRGRHLAGDGNYLIGGAEAFLPICRLTSETSICPVWISLCAFYLIFWGFGFWVFECHMLPPTSCFFIIFPGSILCVASHTSIFSL